MGDATLLMDTPHPPDSRETRLPVWACAILILGFSAGCYWLLFHLFAALLG
jgi:hypothetical protein